MLGAISDLDVMKWIVSVVQLLVLPFSASFKSSKFRQYGSLRSAHWSKFSQVEDDGFSLSGEATTGIAGHARDILKRIAGNKPPGILILVRHGESEWNFNKTFTGWVDVDLCERGRREIEHAARLLL